MCAATTTDAKGSVITKYDSDGRLHLSMFLRKADKRHGGGAVLRSKFPMTAYGRLLRKKFWKYFRQKMLRYEKLDMDVICLGRHFGLPVWCFMCHFPERHIWKASAKPNNTNHRILDSIISTSPVVDTWSPLRTGYGSWDCMVKSFFKQIQDKSITYQGSFIDYSMYTKHPDCPACLFGHH